MRVLLNILIGMGVIVVFSLTMLVVFVGIRLLSRPGTLREEWDDIKRELRHAE